MTYLLLFTVEMQYCASVILMFDSYTHVGEALGEASTVRFSDTVHTIKLKIAPPGVTKHPARMHSEATQLTAGKTRAAPNKKSMMFNII
jgi:hypothetical protein